MRIGSLILSLLALSGLLPFGKLDAAVLVSDQPAAIEESLANAPTRVQSVELTDQSSTAEANALTLTQQLTFAALAIPSIRVSTPAIAPLAAGNCNPVAVQPPCLRFGEIAINAP